MFWKSDFFVQWKIDLAALSSLESTICVEASQSSSTASKSTETILSLPSEERIYLSLSVIVAAGGPESFVIASSSILSISSLNLWVLCVKLISEFSDINPSINYSTIFMDRLLENNLDSSQHLRLAFSWWTQICWWISLNLQGSFVW